MNFFLMQGLSPQSLSGLVVFFLGVLFLYHLTPRRWRWTVLLISSYWFYFCQEPKFWFLLLLQTCLAFFFALAVERLSSQYRRKQVLCIGILTLIGPLLWIKYGSNLGQDLKLVVPLGLSFYTFQALSYLIDVYFRRARAETHPGHLMAFQSFFPLIQAGPIERAGKLLPQIKNPEACSLAVVLCGLELILIGVFKKFAISNNLLPYLDAVYSSPGQYSGFPILLASILDRYRSYCDFSGYSDIAIGVAGTFGICIGPNFNRPFAAKSVGDYWRRWHMSLVAWFRDYVFIPLCRANSSALGIRLSIVLVMLLVGLWHEASSRYLLFGLINGGMLLIGSRMAEPQRRFWASLPRGFARFRNPVALITTFLLLCIPSLIVTTRTLENFTQVIGELFERKEGWFHWGAFRGFLENEQSPVIFFSTLMFIVALELAQYEWAMQGVVRWRSLKGITRVALALLVWGLVLLFSNPEGPAFAYTRF